MREEKGGFAERGGWLALCGGWFFLAYGFCNWWTHQRAPVGTWYYEWERHIPFIPEMVVPYWSLDALFCGAFFLAKTRGELRLLGRRVFLLTTLTCLCFLLWPLQFDLPRPVPTGWTEPWFRLLQANDLPYNLAPSLHIGLRCLLWITYGRHLRGWARTALRWWFILIGASTLLVWQHHLMDVVTGFLAAYVVVALLPDREEQPGPAGPLGERTAASRRLAWRYGAGAALGAALALPGGGWLWFGWPAAACGVMALAYATANPRWLQKSSGNPTPAVEWMLLPVTLAARLWQLPWLLRRPAWQEMAPGVFCGRRLTLVEAQAFLQLHPRTTVLDLTAEQKEAPPFLQEAEYRPLPVLDLLPPSEETCRRACQLTREARAEGRVVYVHCLLGLGRAAAITAAWLREEGSGPHAAAERAGQEGPLRPETV